MKRLLAGFLVIILVFSLAGCASQKPNSTPQNSPEDVPAELYTAMQSFSAQLFGQARLAGEKNIVISPLSAYLAFAMAAAGSAGDTAAEFARVLGIAPADIGPACQALLGQYAALDGGTKLSLANSAWVDDDYPVLPQYLQLVQQDFDGEVFTVDLQASATPEEINAWVAKETEGLIPDLVDSISAQAAMLLINTLYMDAAWQQPFDANDTHARDFTLANGQTVQADFLTAPANTQRCFQNPDLQGVVLPYADSNLAFLAVMPIDGNVANLALDENSLSGWLAAAQDTDDVILSMPKFEQSYELGLVTPLQSMGLQQAFDPTAANFSGVSDANNLYISDAKQKVVIRVNEKGTEAAAATVVEFEVTAAPYQEEPPLYLTFDKPYLYAVVDLSSGLPLFLGEMDSPPPPAA